MVSAGLFLIGLGIGFGLGRVKNASKLAAISAEIAKIRAEVVTDVEKAVARIKAKL